MRSKLLFTQVSVLGCLIALFVLLLLFFQTLKVVRSILIQSRKHLQDDPKKKKNLFLAQFYLCLFETTDFFQDIGTQSFLNSDSFTISWSHHSKAVVRT